MKECFAVSLTARIKDGDGVATVMWQHCLDDFAAGVPADFTSARYRPQDSSDEEVEEVRGKGCDREEKTPLKKWWPRLPHVLRVQRAVSQVPLSPMLVFL